MNSRRTKTLRQKVEELRAENEALRTDALDLMTMEDITEQLKKRDSLFFTLMWMEINGTGSMDFRGRGNPTVLAGMIAKGMHMVLENAGGNCTFGYEENM